MAKLRVLLVSYVFPPTGGAGVARVSKLAKYLAHHGVTASVLTAKNPSVPLLDASRCADVPPAMRILRARTLEPGYAAKQAVWSAHRSAASGANGRATRPSPATRAMALARGVLLPDPQVLWQPGAQLALARRLLGRDADDVVFISAPPFSQLLLGPTVRALGNKALVFDYRDEWSTVVASYEMGQGGLAARVAEPLERALLRRAHAVTTATEAFRLRLLERFPFLRPERVFAIPNGYDRDDLPPDLPTPSGERLVLTYAGTIFRLTSARGLLRAVSTLHTQHPALAARLTVRFLGRIVDTELDAFEGSERYGVERRGYVPHDEVMRALAASHVTLCLLDDVPGVERIYPAKIFELMALGRPCLTLAPPGALVDLVRAHELGPVVGPRDEAAIVAALRELLVRFVAGTSAAATTPRGIERYDRKNLAREFAEVFRKAAAWADEDARVGRGA